MLLESMRSQTMRKLTSLTLPTEEGTKLQERITAP